MDRIDEAKTLIKDLLAHLPDNIKHDEDETWSWCWNELSDQAQIQVKETRKKARDFLGTEYHRIAQTAKYQQRQAKRQCQDRQNWLGEDDSIPHETKL